MFRASFISGLRDFTWNLTSGILSARLIKGPLQYFVAMIRGFLFTFLLLLFFLNFLLYVYNMRVLPLFLKLNVLVENVIEALHVRTEKESCKDGCKSMGNCRSRKADIQRFSVSGWG